MSVVKFPSDKPPVTDVDPDDARRAKAYFDMEPHICDCATMAKIAAQFVVEADNGTNRELVFAACHLYEMLDALKARYYAMDFPS
jgi:hypothetical protein